jgi:serine/threonine-protein kinase
VLRSGATGKTTTSRVKSLLLHAQAKHGKAEADAFLLKTKLNRDYLEDETRPLPTVVWHSALVAFASRFGRDEIPRTLRSVVHPENLGVWTRVLRGTTDVASAFQQLDQYGGDEVMTERWQTAHVGPGLWRGRLPARGSEAPYERDGLCALARAAELSAIPILFGLEAGRVRPLSHSSTGEQEFEVRWREPGRWPLAAGGAAGGALATGMAFGYAMPTDIAAVLVGGLCAAGLVSGFVVAHEVRRRVQSRSQLTRIRTLERAAALRDARERGAAGFHEGVVVAGQYRLGEKLGAGASGAIWEAIRLADGGTVAIKLLRTAVAHDNVAADRLRREAAALGLAWHPNVVEVFDDGHLPDGTSYLVMERLHGESLATRLHRLGAVPPPELLPIALQICDALGAVHAAGVVHRDLKPSNIFLAIPDAEPADEQTTLPSMSGKPPAERVKILDFGIARVEWAETRLTNMGAPLGTPGYMSPEQEQGVEIDARSDLFALGGVIYECLTGIAPPARSSELWTDYDPANGPESGVKRALLAIPDNWRKVIERAMAPLPRDRFSDARAMREALVQLAPARAKSA